MLYVIESESKEWTKNGCIIRSRTKLVSLPSEEVYYAYQDPGLFSDSKFVMNLDDKGNIEGVSMSSESRVSESAKNLSGIFQLFQSLLTEDSSETEAKCKGEKIIKVLPLMEWRDKINKASCNQASSENPPKQSGSSRGCDFQSGG